jgi:hypothetical protein
MGAQYDADRRRMGAAAWVAAGAVARTHRSKSVRSDSSSRRSRVTNATPAGMAQLLGIAGAATIHKILRACSGNLTGDTAAGLTNSSKKVAASAELPPIHTVAGRPTAYAIFDRLPGGAPAPPQASHLATRLLRHRVNITRSA